MKFQEGQTVTWTSQAGGRSKTKTGVVMQVVDAGSRPDRERFLTLYKGAGVGFSRDHESYVVLAGAKLYWPRTSALKPADSKPDELTRLRDSLTKLVEEWREKGELSTLYDWCADQLQDLIE